MNDLSIPRVIGHRGAAGSAPENTLVSFTRAATLGCSWVELDVQLSREGTPVVFHDDRLDRTTDGQGVLIETDLADLRRLDAGAWFGSSFAGERIPTLAEALERIARLGLSVNIEIKASEENGAATALAGLAVAKLYWPADRPVPLISSFARSALAAARQVAPEWPRGLLIEGWPEDWREAAKQLDCVSLNPSHKQLTAERTAAVKAAGLKVLSYTVNEADRARLLWEWGVDGVFSDRPELLLPVTTGTC